MLQATFGVGAFLVTDDADTFTAKATEAADVRGVIAEFPIACEWNEIADQP